MSVFRVGFKYSTNELAVLGHEFAASQAKTVDQVIVSVPVPAFSQANEAQFYVSMAAPVPSMMRPPSNAK